jgi:hypothetical protein
MLQFWQFKHLKLQPAIKTVSLFGGAGCNVAEATVGKVTLQTPVSPSRRLTPHLCSHNSHASKSLKESAYVIVNNAPGFVHEGPVAVVLQKALQGIRYLLIIGLVCDLFFDLNMLNGCL